MDSRSWQNYGQIDSELEQILPDVPKFSAGSCKDVPELRQKLMKLVGQLVATGSFAFPDLAGVSKEDIRVPMRDGESIRTVLYKPENVSAKGPLAILFFGGGWCMGFPESMEKHAVQLVTTYGATVLAPAYRCAPEKPFPGPQNDAWDTLKWAAGNASTIGADPAEGFIVGGISAGGSLSSVVAHQARDEKLAPPLTGVWLYVPFLVHTSVVPEKYKSHYLSYEQNKDAPVLSRRDFDFYLKWHDPDPSSPYFSSLLWPTGHKNLPPTYFQVCGMDILRDEALIFEHILREDCGVATKIDVYPGMPHAAADFIPQLTQSKKTEEDTIVGFKWLLERN